MGWGHVLRYRLMKAFNTVAYVALIVLTWRLIERDLHWKLAIGAVVVSGCWLAVTYVKMGHVLRTYFDVLSRMAFLLPAALGILLSAYAMVFTHHWTVRVVAAGELVAWVAALVLYRRNRSRFIHQGHGPVPAHSWISPPYDVLQPGDLLLTSGRVAAHLHESVGHAEAVVRSTDGAMQSFSSYMGHGATLQHLDELTTQVRSRGHYIVLRLSDGLTDDQVARAAEVAMEMFEENAAWRARINRRRRKIIHFLPLPRSWRWRLIRRTRTDGYDWFGLFMGRLAEHRWTCIGACLELYDRLDVRTRPYGTGLLGFGTSVLDPIMPVRLLDDPAFRLLSVNDRDAAGPDGPGTAASPT